MLKNLFEKITGISRIREETQQAREERLAAIEAAEQAKRDEELAKMTPKERANALGEPWVAVLETHVNKENIRNGFFELDWNDEFVLQLKQAGYGFDGDPDEEIVDRWFRTLCKDVANEEGIDMADRGAGYINVKPLSEGKSEIS